MYVTPLSSVVYQKTIFESRKFSLNQNRCIQMETKGNHITTYFATFSQTVCRFIETYKNIRSKSSSLYYSTQSNAFDAKSSKVDFVRNRGQKLHSLHNMNLLMADNHMNEATRKKEAIELHMSICCLYKSMANLMQVSMVIVRTKKKR